MECALCDSIKKDYSLIKQTKHSFSVIILEPLKPGHLMVMPNRHVTNLKDLTPEESKDILELVDEMMALVEKTYHQDPIIFMNTGKHSTEPHLHFHVLPSKGALRDLVSNFENVPKRMEKSKEELQMLRDELKNNL